MTPQPSAAKASKMDEETIYSPTKPNVLVKFMPIKFTSGEMSHALFPILCHMTYFSWNNDQI